MKGKSEVSASLLPFTFLSSFKAQSIVAGLPLDDDNESPSSTDGGNNQQTEETSKNPFKKGILPPITPNNPATA